MRKVFTIVGLLGLLGFALGGCDSPSVHSYEHGPPRYVYVEHGHVCGPDCHHYWSGERYIVIRDHVHGPGCGHVLREDVLVRTPASVHRSGPAHVHTPPVRVNPPPRRVITVEHVHGPGCGCVFDRRGSKWLVVGKDHVHGRGCGHVFVEGRWSVRY